MVALLRPLHEQTQRKIAVSKTSDKEKLKFAWCKAEIITALSALQDYAKDDPTLRFINGAICIEPCSTGGVLVAGVTGHACAIIHDPDGSASEAMTLSIPVDAFDYGKRAYWSFTFEGQEHELPLPEWCQAGNTYFYNAGMHIAPQMRPPAWADEQPAFYPALYTARTPPKPFGASIGKDYGLTVGAHPWRRLLEQLITAQPYAASVVNFNPQIPNLFDGVLELLGARHGPRASIHRMVKDGKGNPMSILTVDGAPEFVGIYAHQSPTKATDLPAHFLAPTATHEAPANKQ